MLNLISQKWHSIQQALDHDWWAPQLTNCDFSPLSQNTLTL